MSESSPNPESPYDYSTRRGVRPISWNDFHGLTKALVVAVSPWQPEIILPIGRGGYYPGSLLAHILQVEIFPVRLSRREQDVIVRESPQWLITPPDSVRGHRVLVVDEICSTGETLTIVRDRTLSLGAKEVRTAVLYAHVAGSSVPDYVGIITDELVLNPWDREIYVNGVFRFHPEYAEALADQGGNADPSLLIPSLEYSVEKGSPSSGSSGLDNHGRTSQLCSDRS
jgi:hypoxanthine phosphoribosyltransferase